jgi:hypothetical protein
MMKLNTSLKLQRKADIYCAKSGFSARVQVLFQACFELGIHRELKMHHITGAVIQFVTKNLEPDLKWYEPGPKQIVTMVNNESIKWVL